MRHVSLLIVAIALAAGAALPADLPAQAKGLGKPTNQPTAGEVITWQVEGIGGTSAASATYMLLGTLGQTAPGPISSANYRLEQGFWQAWPRGCCVGVTGNVNMVDSVDLSDLSALIAYLSVTGYRPPCMDEANVNGIDIVDLSDLSALVTFLTVGGYVLPHCP